MDIDKSEKLRAFLEKLPEDTLERLTQAVELDKLSGGSELPHGLLLEGLRPSIATSERHLDRTPTPMRMFCMPLEDLLAIKRTEKRAGRVARSSLTPVWEWLASDLMPALFREHYDKLTTAILENDTAKIREMSAEFHEAGTAALTRAMEAAPEGSERRKEIAKQLGGEDVVADAEDMAKALAAASEILDLRDQFVEPVQTLNRELLKKLCGKYDQVAEQRPDSARYLLVVAMQRMSRPWEILRTAAFLPKKSDTGGVARGDLNMVADLLFGDMNDRIAFFEEQNPRTFDPDEACHQLTTYARLAQGIASELEVLNDKGWQEAYDELQTRGARDFERLIEHVPDQIKSAMPFRLIGTYAAKSSRRPDLRSDPDPELLDRAVKLATFMRESRPLAYAANIAETHSDAYDVILDNLNTYRNGLLGELRSFEDASMLSRARAYLDLTVELTAILVSEGEAQIFRRKSAQAERGDQAANG
jgi:hypothetical protein